VVAPLLEAGMGLDFEGSTRVGLSEGLRLDDSAPDPSHCTRITGNS
jgi:hypothetical protein